MSYFVLKTAERYAYLSSNVMSVGLQGASGVYQSPSDLSGQRGEEGGEEGLIELQKEDERERGKWTAVLGTSLPH